MQHWVEWLVTSVARRNAILAKLGQLCAPHVGSQKWPRLHLALSRLQTGMPSLPLSNPDISMNMNWQEWRRAGVHIEEHALASGIIAQVHRGTLPILEHGSPYGESPYGESPHRGSLHESPLRKLVVIKVFKRDILRHVEQSYKRIHTWLRWFQWIDRVWNVYWRKMPTWESQWNLTLRFNNIYKQLIEQCDARQEIRNLQEFHRAYKHHHKIVIPRVLEKWCTEHVIVMEYLEGHKWQSQSEHNDVTEISTLCNKNNTNNANHTNNTNNTNSTNNSGNVWNPECKSCSLKSQVPLCATCQEKKKSCVNALIGFAVSSIYLEGRFHADLHPGNVLIMDQGDKIGILDFGFVGRLDPVSRQDLLDTMLDIVKQDTQEATLKFHRLMSNNNPDQTIKQEHSIHSVHSVHSLKDITNCHVYLARLEEILASMMDPETRATAWISRVLALFREYHISYSPRFAAIELASFSLDGTLALAQCKNPLPYLASLFHLSDTNEQSPRHSPRHSPKHSPKPLTTRIELWRQRLEEDPFCLVTP